MTKTIIETTLKEITLQCLGIQFAILSLILKIDAGQIPSKKDLEPLKLYINKLSKLKEELP